jgi:hypothetical protein
VEESYSRWELDPVLPEDTFAVPKIRQPKQN